MLKQQRMKPHKNNLIKMYLIFSYFFYLSDSFDVLEFKTKPKGSYGSAGNRVPIARGRWLSVKIIENYFQVYGTWTAWSDWEACSIKRIHKMMQLSTSVRTRTCSCEPCTIYCRKVQILAKIFFWPFLSRTQKVVKGLNERFVKPRAEPVRPVKAALITLMIAMLPLTVMVALMLTTENAGKNISAFMSGTFTHLLHLEASFLIVSMKVKYFVRKRFQSTII